jgi:ABC-type nitrate/sulfonate/bicarbonate transport system substrate-binding protein
MKTPERESIVLSTIILAALVLWPERIVASTPLRLAYTAISPTQSIAWIAYEEGLLRKNGIAAELIYTRGGSTTVQSLLSGEQQIAQVGGAAAISAMLQGANILFVGLLVQNYYFDFIVSPEIKQIGDLRNKRVAVTGLGNITHIGTILLLDKYKLIPHKDVVIVRVGGFQEAMAALISGGVQGAILAAPFNERAVKAGAKRFLRMKEENIFFPLNTLVARRSDLERNRSAYVAIMKAFLEAIRFLKLNKERSIQIMAKYTRITDRSSLVVAYDEALNTVDDPQVNEKIIQAALQLMASINNVAHVPEANSVIDNSVLEEAKKELGMAGR